MLGRVDSGDAPAARAGGAVARRRLAWRGAEFVGLFGLIPLVLALARLRGSVLPCLLLAFAFCLRYLLRDRDFRRQRLWNRRAAVEALPGILLRFAVVGPLMALGVWLLDPGSFLNFPRRLPVIWALVMVLYPLLSVYPQEVIFRAFVFHRYRRLFTSPAARMGASALAFGFVHILFHSWLSVALTIPGGYLFADTYRRSRSVLAAAIEHSLYGCLVFTIGLGRHFYNGAV